jgi:hypothetical protein
VCWHKKLCRDLSQKWRTWNPEVLVAENSPVRDCLLCQSLSRQWWQYAWILLLVINNTWLNFSIHFTQLNECKLQFWISMLYIKIPHCRNCITESNVVWGLRTYILLISLKKGKQKDRLTSNSHYVSSYLCNDKC